jgi:ammonia channel protein AmtB
MNTVISGSVGGVVGVFVKPRILGTYSHVNQYDCIAVCGGILAGLVSVTGCCDCVEPWAAFIIGGIGALFYILGCYLLDRFHIDDPVEASPVHLFGGMWGTLATGLFSNSNGLFYDVPDKGRFFGVQILGMLAILVWVSITTFIIFYTLKKLDLFRIEKSIEIIGLDIAEMGGVPEELYEKMRRDFGGSVNVSPAGSFNQPRDRIKSAKFDQEEVED